MKFILKKHIILFVFLAALININSFAQNNKKNKNISSFEIKAYPNPVKSGNYLTIEFENFSKEKPVSISLTNIIGKQLLKTQIDTANFKLQILKQKYPAGIYILKAKQGSKIRALRLNIVK